MEDVAVKLSDVSDLTDNLWGKSVGYGRENHVRGFSEEQ